jgi:hypothetical protein
VYWQRLPSRSRIVFAQSFGRFFGTLAKFTATITAGTRIGPRTACTALSCKGLKEGRKRQRFRS